MAAIQVAAIVAGMKLARRVDQLSTQLNQEIKPLIANLTAVAEQASHTASLASHQVERVDRLFGEMATRVDETIAVAQQFVRGRHARAWPSSPASRPPCRPFGIREASRRGATCARTPLPTTTNRSSSASAAHFRFDATPPGW